MKVGVAIEAAAASERRLAEELVRVGERHEADHDVFHVTRTLSRLSQQHVELLSPHAERYSASLDADAAEPPTTGGEPALLLLHDLRRLYLLASEASIDWVMLAQGAQAVKDSELLDTVTRCHDETLRTVK